jgi:hypothetical protein
MNNLIEHHKNFTDSRGIGIYLGLFLAGVKGEPAPTLVP